MCHAPQLPPAKSDYNSPEEEGGGGRGGTESTTWLETAGGRNKALRANIMLSAIGTATSWRYRGDLNAAESFACELIIEKGSRGRPEPLHKIGMCHS